MSRRIAALVLACGLWARADDLKKERPKPSVAPQEEVPPEEDQSLAVEKKDYAFNPLQADKEMKTGAYYFHKGSYRAAANRFREATRWNEGLADAWLRLGEAAEKMKDRKTAHEAYAKYLELAPDAKNAPELRKKLDKWK